MTSQYGNTLLASNAYFTSMPTAVHNHSAAVAASYKMQPQLSLNLTN